MGFQALGNLFLFLLGGAVEFFARFVGKKVAITSTFLVASSALLAGLFVTVSNSFVFAAHALPSSSNLVMLGFWLAVPPSAPACVTAVITVDAVLAVYGLNMKVVKTVATAST